MAGSISGLVSGLDTATIISQLMQLEAIPQNRIKTRVASEESALKLLQGLNARFAALTTQAKDLTKAGAWTPITATSSHDGVTVTTTSGTSTGSLSFTVDQTALAHKLSFTSTSALTDVVVPLDAGGKHTVILTIAGTPQTVDAGDGTLAGLVGALNGGGTGVSATALKLDDGTYRLQVQSTKTGATSTVSLTAGDGSALLGGAATLVTGRDAAITIGGDTLHSATNSFSGVMPGLEITVSTAAIGSTVEVEVAGDTGQVVGKAKSFVDSINAALTEIDGLTAYNPATKSSGMLSGDPGLRSLRGQLLDSIYPGDGTSLAGIGIQVDRTGKLVFDEEKFKEAYAADPTGVAAKFTTGAEGGFAARVQAVANTASNKVDGTLTTAITGRNDGIERMQDNIEQWDIRLELRQTTLTRQFTALETALSRMNSQSSWLAGQIGSLSNSSGS